MNLSIKEIKQIALEELRKTLKENLYNKNYNIMVDRIENEPEAQAGENSPMDQAIKMLTSNNDEELEMFLLAFSDDLPALAYQLFMSNDLESYKGQRFLGSIGRMGNQYPDAARLVEDYLGERINNLKSKFKSVKEKSELGNIEKLLRGDQVLMGYLGIVNASIDQDAGFLELEMDNEKSIEKIAELWLENYITASETLLLGRSKYIEIVSYNVGDKPNAMVKLRLSTRKK